MWRTILGCVCGVLQSKSNIMNCPNGKRFRTVAYFDDYKVKLACTCKPPHSKIMYECGCGN